MPRKVRLQPAPAWGGGQEEAESRAAAGSYICSRLNSITFTLTELHFLPGVVDPNTLHSSDCIAFFP